MWLEGRAPGGESGGLFTAVRPLLADELPVVDEVLAGALTAQGEAGVRVLGLPRDVARGLLNAAGALPAAGADGGVPEEVAGTGRERVRQAAQVLRGQLARPGPRNPDAGAQLRDALVNAARV